MPEKKFSELLGQLNDLRTSFARLKKAELSLLPDTRRLKVHTHLRTNGRKPTTACPKIILRGNWLAKAGFHHHDQWVHVITIDEMIIITPAPKKHLG